MKNKGHGDIPHSPFSTRVDYWRVHESMDHVLRESIDGVVSTRSTNNGPLLFVDEPEAILRKNRRKAKMPIDQTMTLISHNRTRIQASQLGDRFLSVHLLRNLRISLPLSPLPFPEFWKESSNLTRASAERLPLTKELSSRRSLASEPNLAQRPSALMTTNCIR